MIISVASGKGGTGKTTIAVNLAVSLGNVRLLDCDVEEPNAHLFLHPEIEGREIARAPVPKIDEARCTHCGKCAAICRFKAIAVLPSAVLVFPKMCHGCGGCVEVCPEKAVTETTRELGVVEWGRAGSVEFVHGRLEIGEPMAPPLIQKVRARWNPDKVNIIDAPPGTSCPVIASMRGTDFVILVTEPTPFGLHDLKLAVGAVQFLGIPCGIVVNRADIGDREVFRYAAGENIPILMELAFDRRIAEAYSRGKLVVEAMPEWRGRFLELYESVRKMAGERRQ